MGLTCSSQSRRDRHGTTSIPSTQHGGPARLRARGHVHEAAVHVAGMALELGIDGYVVEGSCRRKKETRGAVRSVLTVITFSFFISFLTRGSLLSPVDNEYK